MRVRELDGIRGLAILLVLVVHFGLVPGLPDPLLSVVNFGWTGVDVFFVLSGYLITSILLRTRLEPDYFRAFYTNRVLRIFPLYYAFLAGFTLLVAAPALRVLCYWLYVGNFLNAFGRSIPSLNHFWSLAIEEQFYLIWPLVVWKLAPRGLIRLCAAAIATIVVVRFGVVHFPLPAREFVYTITPLRCDALLFGALVACLNARGQLARYARVIKWTALAGAASLAMGIFRAHGTGYVEPGTERYAYFGVDLMCASLVAAAALWRESRWFGLARSPVMVFFGKYSYGIYVFHYPIARYLVEHFHPVDNPVLRSPILFLTGTALSVVAALISWNLLERHCLALKERLHAHALAAQRA